MKNPHEKKTKHTLIYSLRNIFKTHFLIIAFLTFYFFSIASVLVNRPTPFFDWDESIYVQIGKETVDNMSFIPTWQGYRWLDKSFFIPATYELVSRAAFFTMPEVSMRIFSLVIAVITLFFIYKLCEKVLKNPYLSALSVMITAFAPVFLQRAQIVNIDLFLLFGWVGYGLFFHSFWLGFFFLFVAVMAKSLVGFYPVPVIGLFYLYQLWIKKIKPDEFRSVLRQLSIHSLLLTSWYIGMLLMYGKAFWIEHIIETHFKRVTASIEFHFGERIFYVILMKDQLAYYFYLSLAGMLLFAYRFFKKQLSTPAMLFGLYLMPWFIFLNLTKTKIFWYALPAIPVFALFAFYPFTLLKKYRVLLGIAVIFFIGITVYVNLIRTNFLNSEYSKKEDHYYLALYARDYCNQLGVLVNNDTRTSFETLSKMNLLITTSKWWGSHPSIRYYFGKQMYPFYDTREMYKYIYDAPGKSCLTIEATDLSLIKGINTLKPLKQFGQIYLYTK